MNRADVLKLSIHPVLKPTVEDFRSAVKMYETLLSRCRPELKEAREWIYDVHQGDSYCPANDGEICGVCAFLSKLDALLAELEPEVKR